QQGSHQAIADLSQAFEAARRAASELFRGDHEGRYPQSGQRLPTRLTPRRSSFSASLRELKWTEAMETRAGDPGAFAQFDLHRVDSPSFVVDAARLRHNLRILAEVRDEAGIKMLSALKAFSMWKVAPLIGEYLDGVCTSGLWEARLAGEFYDGE